MVIVVATFVLRCYIANDPISQKRKGENMKIASLDNKSLFLRIEHPIELELQITRQKDLDFPITITDKENSVIFRVFKSLDKDRPLLLRPNARAFTTEKGKMKKVVQRKVRSGGRIVVAFDKENNYILFIL